jgi:hypothetical protein
VFATGCSTPSSQEQWTAGRQDRLASAYPVSRHLARLMGGDLMHRRRDGETQFVLSLPAE